ncbi:MAG: hypothetical protein ACR2HH_09290 [Chthoniobacterales bacterium]
MTVNQVLKRLEQAQKVLKAIAGIATVAVGTKEVLGRSLPSLRLRRDREKFPENNELRKHYDQVVEELKAEHAAHEQTKEYLRWATKEIENVKEAMREWQKKALLEQPSRRRRPRASK